MNQMKAVVKGGDGKKSERRGTEGKADNKRPIRSLGLCPSVAFWTVLDVNLPVFSASASLRVYVYLATQMQIGDSLKPAQLTS